MARWNKGDPHPKNWPAWLREADIEWCEVEIEDNWVLWKFGVWESGAWRDGVWQNGTWVSGDWHNGTWNHGVWRGGTWHNGTWHGGHWLDGVWLNGVWEDGVWESGAWRDGVWESGHQMRPKFGWALWPGGLIGGYFKRGWGYRTPEDWEPHLKDMEPQKVDEYYALLHWMKLQERRKPTGPRPSLWEHIEGEP